MNTGDRLNVRENLADPDRKRRLNERIFSIIAPHYDMINRGLSFGRDQSWKRYLIAALPQVAAPCCVDLACGTGDLAFLLATRYPEGKIVGLDLTEPMLVRARKANRFEHIEFRRGDMADTGLPDASVDIVTGGYALRNAADLAAALREVRRILKPGGAAAFLDFSKPPDGLRQRLQLGLLRFWGGFWGVMLHGEADVYAYIAESLRCFPDRIELGEMLEKEGLSTVSLRLFIAGMIECRVTRKVS
jgi:demethylmenaquinone methyltransferase/2-methoxy-6-polyprenyl-1,4-benzoquinol methylase